MSGLRSAGVTLLGFLILVSTTATLLSGCGGRKRQLPTDGTATTVAAATRPQDRSRAVSPLLLRVGLAVEQPQARIVTSGPCLLRAGTERHLVNRLTRATEVSTEVEGDQLRWRAGGSGQATTLFIQPLDPRHLLYWQETPYRGELMLLPTAGGVTVVNIVELETYLRGVVPWEIGRHGPEVRAALEAQAVAARTYTVSHLGERESFGFDVWASVQDQVYRGAAGEDEVCNEAIRHTAGLVLRHADQEIEAYYCSTCGGHTSSVEEVWPRPARPYLRGHRDSEGGGAPFCSASPRFAWEVTWHWNELEELLARSLPDYISYMGAEHRATWAGKLFTPGHRRADARQPGALRSLYIAVRTTSGRVARLDVTTDAGVYHVRGDRVRWVLLPPAGKPSILWSAWFDLEVTPAASDRSSSDVIARGHGSGHGVGMCQHGALGMARRGYTSSQILAHYYPGARLAAITAP
jgi:stage II sporulation protein D